MRLYPQQQAQGPTATHENTRVTGFGENWSAALGLAMNEDLPIISPMITSNTESYRNRKLYDYMESGTIPQKAVDYYGDDVDGLAWHARNSLNLMDIPTLEEFEKLKKEEYANYRAQSAAVFAQQGKLGMAGMIAGYGHAMALDPIYASSFLTGYGAATTAGKAIMYAGAIEAGIETLAQPFKMNFKEEIGADYGAAQALTEIVFAGVGASALAALGKGIGKAMTPRDLTVKEGIDVLEALAKKDKELGSFFDVPLQRLKRADGTDNLYTLLTRDQQWDIDQNLRKGWTDGDPKGDLDKKVSEFDADNEARWAERTGEAEEGVTARQMGMDEGEWTDYQIYQQLTPEERAELLSYREEVGSKTQLEEGVEPPEPMSLMDEMTAYREFAEKGEGQRDVQLGSKVQAPEATARTPLPEEADFAEYATFAQLPEARRKYITEAQQTAGLEVQYREAQVEITNNPMVKEADLMVVKMDEGIKIMEDCF